MLYTIPLNDAKEPECGEGWCLEANYETNTNICVPGKPYGVLTGLPNRLIVIDFDVYKEDIPPEQVMRTWEYENPYVVKTRQGGLHLYFAWDDRFKDWPGVTGLDRYIDIRTTGNYVVGPDSPGYELLVGDINNLPSMPSDLYEKLNSKIFSRNGRDHPSFDQALVTPKLERMGFTNVCFLNGGSNYNFDCDQCRPPSGTPVGQCPCCGDYHEGNGKGGGNYFFVKVIKGKMFVKNHSGRCRRKYIC